MSSSNIGSVVPNRAMIDAHLAKLRSQPSFYERYPGAVISDPESDDDDPVYIDNLYHTMSRKERDLYNKQVHESDGFDVQEFPGAIDLGIIIPALRDEDQTNIRCYANLAIEQHNEKHELVMDSWADLPKDLWKLIAERICGHRDFVHFGAVCKLWRSIVLDNLHQLPYKLPLSNCLPCECPLPLLMQCNNEKATGTADFFSIRDQKIYSGFVVPGIDNKKWISGSFDGWVVTVEIVGRQIELLNPFTGAQIPLPSLSALKYPRGSCDRIEEDDFGLLSKVIILSGSSSRRKPADDCIVVALISCLSVLSFCRPGDDKWTNIEGSPMRLSDIISYKGQVYAVDDDGHTMACDVAGNQKITPIVGRVNLNLIGQKYLVESTSGDLLQVARETEYDSPSRNAKTIDFTVFKLESLIDSQIDMEVPIFCYGTVDDEMVRLDDLRSKWVELDDLGDQMLFLGKNRSMSLPAASYPGCKGNCIYFTDEDARHMANARDIRDGYELSWDAGDYDMGMFDMESGDVFPFEEMKDKCFTVPPVWIVPNPW